LADRPEDLAGVPVSLQLVSRRFEDEKVVAVLEYLKQEIGLPLADVPGLFPSAQDEYSSYFFS
jgi:Asp-tRNA(Asn)/Glu-tRNA(Gln) amidotransferase A subunit family amidase